jgi:hypothetical protein
MRKLLTTIALAGALVACGQGGGAGAPAGEEANTEACALITDAAAIFGEGASVAGYAGPAPIASDCQFTSADGARTGGVMLFTAQSLGGTAPEAQFADLAQKWDGVTETPLEPVAQLGDEAQLAKDLPGYQTQIVIRAGTSVIAVLGSSGDDAMSGEEIARALAAQAVAQTAAAP